MQKIQMTKCPNCKQDFPVKRKELGYRVCIQCSEEKPKVAVNTINGQGDHTWNDVLIMDQDKAHGIARKAAELKGKKVDLEILDLDTDENEIQRKIQQEVQGLIHSGEAYYEDQQEEEDMEEGIDY